MLYDCYGFPRTSSEFQRGERRPADIAEADNYTYIRFTLDTTCAIQRIDKSVSGVTSIRWAYGAWADRATLDYSADLNTAINVEEVAE